MSVYVPTPENGGKVNRPFVYASVSMVSPNSGVLMMRFEPTFTWNTTSPFVVQRLVLGAGDV